jgi:hypothetical protein
VKEPRNRNLPAMLVQEADWGGDAGWILRHVDMAGCPARRSAGGGVYLCQYFDSNLQGGGKGRMGLMHAELGGVRTEVVNIERKRVRGGVEALLDWLVIIQPSESR